MKDFTGKTAFITGGGAGLGLGIAKVFSEAGSSIVIADIRQDHLDEAMAYFKDRDGQVHPIRLDITDREAYARAADEVEDVFGGPPQLLFNNAGVNTFGPVEASTYEDWDWVLGVNLFGVINGMQTFVPRMIKSGKEGHIVNVASLAAFSGGGIVAPYSASKAAVVNISESYRTNLEQYNIGVSVCCPANIKTRIYEATYTRPEHLRNTGYLVTDGSIKTLQNLHSHGMEPVELANHIKKGIEKNRLYIIPYPDPKPRMKAHFDEILDSIPSPDTDPEGMKKRMEAMLKMRQGDHKGEPFGRPRPELDWVKPRKMPPPPPSEE